MESHFAPAPKPRQWWQLLAHQEHTILVTIYSGCTERYCPPRQLHWALCSLRQGTTQQSDWLGLVAMIALEAQSLHPRQGKQFQGKRTKESHTTTMA
eukprot:1493527-Amphidinium_carterae.1